MIGRLHLGLLILLSGFILNCQYCFSEDQSLIYKKVIILGKELSTSWAAELQASEMDALQSTPKNHPWCIPWKSGALDKKSEDHSDLRRCEPADG